MAKKTKEREVVTNGGSAIGEAIGTYMQVALEEFIDSLIEEYECHFVKKIGYNPTTKKTSKKLLLYDSFGNDYNIDGVITNEKMQPLVLLESKYIRYKKHNRDKGSWICNAHSSIRKRYTSIRGSIAVLAGNWSKTSLLMMESSDVNIFLIQFDYIAALLAEKGIDFNWEENDYDKAQLAWNNYNALSYDEKMDIARRMIFHIKDGLAKTLNSFLVNNAKKEVKHIIVEIVANTGETKRLTFKTIQEALEFFEDFSIEEVFNSASFLTIFDVPTANE